MTENVYQGQLIKRIQILMPDCVVLKNDPQYQQGILDLTVFLGSRWGALEVKTSARAPMQPNQDYYIQLLDAMSFARVIYPENEAEVLDELQQALAPRRRTRVS
jgi:hypothetical protein